jgi:hypothetical protein
MRGARRARRVCLSCPESVRGESKTQAGWREACAVRAHALPHRIADIIFAVGQPRHRAVRHDLADENHTAANSAATSEGQNHRARPREDNGERRLEADGDRRVVLGSRIPIVPYERQNATGLRARSKWREPCGATQNATISMARRVVRDPVASDWWLVASE